MRSSPVVRDLVYGAFDDAVAAVGAGMAWDGRGEGHPFLEWDTSREPLGNLSEISRKIWEQLVNFFLRKYMGLTLKPTFHGIQWVFSINGIAQMAGCFRMEHPGING